MVWYGMVQLQAARYITSGRGSLFDVVLAAAAVNERPVQCRFGDPGQWVAQPSSEQARGMVEERRKKRGGWRSRKSSMSWSCQRHEKYHAQYLADSRDTKITRKG